MDLNKQGGQDGCGKNLNNLRKKLQYIADLVSLVVKGLHNNYMCGTCMTLLHLSLLLQHGGQKMSFSQFVLNLEGIGVKVPRDLLKVCIIYITVVNFSA